MFSITGKPKAQPSFRDGFARSPGESVAPELRDGLIGAWIPSLGCQGNSIINVITGGRMLWGDNSLAWGCDKNGPIAKTNQSGSTVGGSAIKDPALNVMLYSDYISIACFSSTSNTEQTDKYVCHLKFSNGREFGIIYGYVSRTYELFGLGRATIGTLSSGDLSTHFLAFSTNVAGLSDIYYDGRYITTKQYGNIGKNAIASFSLGTVAKDAPINNWMGSFSQVYMFDRQLKLSDINSLSADPLLPFRRRKPVFYSLPTIGFNLIFARKKSFPRALG